MRASLEVLNAYNVESSATPYAKSPCGEIEAETKSAPPFFSCVKDFMIWPRMLTKYIVLVLLHTNIWSGLLGMIITLLTVWPLAPPIGFKDPLGTLA
jgi:hypothetical protein